MSNSFLLSADSYKYSHANQLPPDLDKTYFYITARQPTKDLSATQLRASELPAWLEMQTKLHKDLFGNVVFLGLQTYLKKYFVEKSLVQSSIKSAAALLKKHGEPFNLEGFSQLQQNQFHLKLNAGTDYWPAKILALPEGSLVPVGTPMVTVQSLDDYPWFPSFTETSLLRAIWYPTTVATIAWQVKQVCKYFLKLTGGDKAVGECLSFMLHDFGARGYPRQSLPV